MQNMPAIVAEWVAVLFIAAIAVMVLIKIWSDKIDLTGLLCEADPTTPGPGGGKASLSRLQLLLFTVVIVGLFLTLSLEAGEMVAIPNQVLGLLGISGGSYVVSKGIQMNKKQGEQ